MPNLTFSAATRRSHDSAISSPPASAKPSMAAISGFLEPCSKKSPRPLGGPLEANALRSMPAQNPRPAPVSTPVVSPSLLSSSWTAASSPWARSVLMAFMASGRLSVINSTRPLVSVSTASDMRRSVRQPPGPLRTRPRRPRALASSPVFTGIVEELGQVAERDGDRLRISCSTVLDDVVMGASIAVNGCCLTVVGWGDDWWDADLTDETWSRTSLGDLAPGDAVNLERPVRLMDRLGGHLVQGHVDGVGEIVEPAPDLRVRCDRELLRYVVEKGSITVDGISLTVVDPLDDGFTVAVIPHTADVTTLGHKGPGARVNLEVDVTAKYVERLLSWKDGAP